jgi:hypothetical protein
MDLVSAVGGELDDALARDPGQDGAAGGRRGDDAALDDEDVARGDLLEVPIVDGVEVEHVREPPALGVHLRLDDRRVVGDGLDAAGAAGHRAVDTVPDDQVDRLQAPLEVVPHGRGVHQERVLRRRRQTQDRAAPDQQRTDVQRALPHRRHLIQSVSQGYLPSSLV